MAQKRQAANICEISERILMTSTTVYICIITFIGAFIQASTGFGFAIITMATMPLLLSVTDSIMVLLFCSTLTIGYLAMKNIKHVNYRLLLVPLIFSLAGNYVGLTFLFHSENALALKLLGGLLIMLSVYFFLFTDKIRLPNNQLCASLAGICSGLLGGFFNVPGPPMVLYYSVTIKEKQAYFATLQMLFFLSVIFKMIYFIVTQGISNAVKPVIPYAVLASTAGMMVGILLFNRMSSNKIKKIVYIVMALSGVWYIIK